MRKRLRRSHRHHTILIIGGAGAHQRVPRPLVPQNAAPLNLPLVILEFSALGHPRILKPLD